MKKGFAILIVLAMVGLLGWKVSQKVFVPQKGVARRGGTPAVAVEISPVRKSTIRDVGFFTGSLSPRSQFIVAPKIGGRLEKLMVNMGDQVQRGQQIALLDDEEYVQQVDQARAELEVARANLEQSRSALDIAKRELGRITALHGKNIVSEAELDAAEAEFTAQSAKHKVAQAQIAQKEAELKAAKVRLSYTKICVACEEGDGQWVVGERFVDEGSMLAPHASIVSVLDIGSLIAVVHVIERDYSKVKLGQEALVTTDAFPERSFYGKVVRVAPLLKETSREARVEIEIPNREDLLKPGMFVRVQIEFDRHDHATVVPLYALTKRKGVQGVFLADHTNRKAQFVAVTLGIMDGEWVEVISPSLSGSVVTLGQHLLEDGSPIELPAAKPAGPSKGEGDPGAAAQARRPAAPGT